MTFAEKLKKAMKELDINQAQVARLIGKSKGSVSQYIAGTQVPPENVQRDIAVSLGLSPDYFEGSRTTKSKVSEHKIPKMLPEEAAAIMGVSAATVRHALQQQVFPWGYAIKTAENRWTYFINAKRFYEIEALDTERKGKTA